MNYKFSVLYPVHDDVVIKKIIKSINSILKNSLTPNEVLIMIDGKISREKSLFFKNISQKFKYIRVIKNKKIGLTKILNKGIYLTKYDIIVRADSDDYNYKNRFKNQLDYFVKKKLDVLGCYLNERYDTSRLIRKTPKHPKIFLSMLINPINHMTAVYKKKSIINLKGYPDIKYKEDMALWIKSIIHGLKIENMAKTLVSTDVDCKRYNKRKNYLSVISEFKLYLFVLKIKPSFFIFGFFTTILRIFYLILPIPFFKFIQINFFRK